MAPRVEYLLSEGSLGSGCGHRRSDGRAHRNLESAAQDCYSSERLAGRNIAARRVRRLAIAVRIGMGRAHFDHADFLGAARTLVIERGPAAVTVGSVTQHLGAPTGSF